MSLAVVGRHRKCRVSELLIDRLGDFKFVLDVFFCSISTVAEGFYNLVIHES